MCKQLSHLCGDVSYTAVTQGVLFQIDYFRDPMRVSTDAYKKHSQLAQWNNKGMVVNATFKENFGKTKRFAMIKAEQAGPHAASPPHRSPVCTDAPLTRLLPRTPWCTETKVSCARAAAHYLLIQ